MFSRSIWLLAVLVFALAACATSKAYVNSALNDAPQFSLPRRILLIPSEIRVSEVTAGGVSEQVYDWSKQAAGHVVTALRSQASSRQMFAIVDMPDLNEQEKAIVDQHVAMYELVATHASEFGVSTDSVWRKKSKELHYTLGPGLMFLAEKTGADAALFLLGADAVSTTGRRIVMVLTMVLFGGLPAVPPGYSFLAAGVVDLRTGDLLWLDYDWNLARRDLRRAEDAAALVGDVFQSYPSARTMVGAAR